MAIKHLKTTHKVIMADNVPSPEGVSPRTSGLISHNDLVSGL